MSHIFVDEVHCTISWGAEFRPAFKQISKLRSIFPCANVIGMTATASLKMQSSIIEILELQNVNIISINPNRENINLRVSRRDPIVGSKVHVDDVYHKLLLPYINDLIDRRLHFPKTIIYSSLRLCGLGYELVKRETTGHPDEDTIMACVSQYHSPSTEEVFHTYIQLHYTPNM